MSQTLNAPVNVYTTSPTIQTIYASISLALQTFLPFCFAPRLVINVKEHENRVHVSELGGELSDMVFEMGHPSLPQGIQQMENFA